MLTNCHILEGRSHAVIILGENNLNRVDLVEADFEKDTCIIKSKNVLDDYQINFRDLNDLQIGEEVLAIGNPSGFEKSISTGVISGIRTINNVSIIKTNAEISGGSSGGGLFDLYGNLIGVTSFGIKGKEGLNFAISIEEFISF